MQHVSNSSLDNFTLFTVHSLSHGVFFQPTLNSV